MAGRVKAVLGKVGDALRQGRVREPGGKNQKRSLDLHGPQRGLAVSTVRGHLRIGGHDLGQLLDNRIVPSPAARDAARAVGDDNGRQRHGGKLFGATLDVGFELDRFPVAGPACPRRWRRHPGRVHRNARGHHRPPLGFRHRFTADDEHADPRLPPPIIRRFHGWTSPPARGRSLRLEAWSKPWSWIEPTTTWPACTVTSVPESVRTRSAWSSARV